MQQYYDYNSGKVTPYLTDQDRFLAQVAEASANPKASQQQVMIADQDKGLAKSVVDEEAILRRLDPNYRSMLTNAAAKGYLPAGSQGGSLGSTNDHAAIDNYVRDKLAPQRAAEFNRRMKGATN